MYNLQRSLSDKCDFSVGASRVFRLPVGVQLDSPKHITPAPNQYDVCILKMLLQPLLPTPNADNQTCVFSVTGQLQQSQCMDVLFSGHLSFPFQNWTQLLSWRQQSAIAMQVSTLTPFLLFCLVILVLTCAEGHYNINNNNTRCVSKAVVSPFRSKTERILAPVDQHVPGPGAYSPHLAPAPVKQTLLR